MGFWLTSTSQPLAQVFPHSVKGQESVLSLLSLGCLMLKDRPTARAATILTGIRSSSLAHFPHHLDHLQWGIWTCSCLGYTPFFTGKFSFSSIVPSCSFSSPEGRNPHIPHEQNSGDPGIQTPHNLQHHYTSAFAMFVLLSQLFLLGIKVGFHEGTPAR